MSPTTRSNVELVQRQEHLASNQKMRVRVSYSAPYPSVEKKLSRLAHNQKVVGANPTRGTKYVDSLKARMLVSKTNGLGSSPSRRANVGLPKRSRELSTKQSGRLIRCKGSNPLANAKRLI